MWREMLTDWNATMWKLEHWADPEEINMNKLYLKFWRSKIDWDNFIFINVVFLFSNIGLFTYYVNRVPPLLFFCGPGLDLRSVTDRGIDMYLSNPLAFPHLRNMWLIQNDSWWNTRNYCHRICHLCNFITFRSNFLVLGRSSCSYNFTH